MSTVISVNPETFSFRYVAVCDVLGFSHLVKGKSLRTMVEIYQIMLKSVEAIQRLSSNTSLVAGSPLYVVHTTVFSDTFIVYTDPIIPTETILDAVVVSCFFDVCNTLCSLNMGGTTPLRIGIAYGETYFDMQEGIFLGSPLVAADEAEIKQDWIGGACDCSCEKAPHFESARTRWQDVIKYEVPLHSGQESMWALNWHRRSDFDEHSHYLKGKIAQISNLRIKKKYEEALLFWNALSYDDISPRTWPKSIRSIPRAR